MSSTDSSSLGGNAKLNPIPAPKIPTCVYICINIHIYM